jgi:hypothetical protein
LIPQVLALLIKSSVSFISSLLFIIFDKGNTPPLAEERHIIYENLLHNISETYLPAIKFILLFYKLIRGIPIIGVLVIILSSTFSSLGKIDFFSKIG